LIAASFVDRLGGALLMPFFALYITSRFGVDLIGVGLLFALFAIAHGLGSIAGGMLADKVGRRFMINLGLVASGLTSLGMGLAGSLSLFYTLSFLAGFTGSLAGPARQATV
jgi:sugar phosphate permease